MQGAGVEVAQSTSQDAKCSLYYALLGNFILSIVRAHIPAKAESPAYSQLEWALTGVVERGTAAWSARCAKPSYIFLIFVVRS